MKKILCNVTQLIDGFPRFPRGFVDDEIAPEASRGVVRDVVENASSFSRTTAAAIRHNEY